MFKNMSLKKTNILIGLLITSLIFFEMSFLSNSNIVFTVNVSIGFIVGFYICYENKILPGLLISTIVARYVGGILFNDFSLLTSIPHTLIYSTFVGALTFGLSYAFKHFDCALPNTLPKALRYILLIGVVTSITSLLPASLHMFLGDVELIPEARAFIKPTTMGIGIFTTLIIFSSKYDTPIGKHKESMASYIIFLVMFNMVTVFTFQSSILYDEYIYVTPVMLVLFMTHAFIFNFRLLILSSISYIFYYSIILYMYSPPNTESLIFSFNVIVVSILVVTIISKVLISSTDEHAKNVEHSNSKLEDMMNSTFDLFKIEDFIKNDQEGYVETYLSNVFEIVLQLFNKIDSGICIRTEKNSIHIVNSKGYKTNSLNTLDIKRDKMQWNIEKPIFSRKTNEFYDLLIDPEFRHSMETIPSVKESIRFAVPLGNNEFGGIIMDIKQGSKEHFTETDIDNISHLQKMLISFYDKNQLSLRNTNLKDDIVLSLIRTLELFDQYTGGHSEEVADLSKLIAQKLELPTEDIYNIYWAGIVHDIGKIGVDPAIINKQTRLTIDEYEQVKLHTLDGYSILNRSEDLKEIAILVRHHHEWWNGQGYPDKIEQSDIPFGSQILQVSDSVSSMATKRSYSEIKTMNEIKSELKLYSGTQFSPIVVKAMIELINEGHISAYYNSRRK